MAHVHCPARVIFTYVPSLKKTVQTCLKRALKLLKIIFAKMKNSDWQDWQDLTDGLAHFEKCSKIQICMSSPNLKLSANTFSST